MVPAKHLSSALIGRQVELLYHPDTPDQVEVRYQQKSYGIMRPVDLHVNCRVKRDKNNNMQMQSKQPVTYYQGGKLLSTRRPEDER